MNIIDANIGSSKDNMGSPVHNWYKFTAGFSYKFVDLILDDYSGLDIVVYEPFAGCGTTLVECQKRGFYSVGNESQELMCDIINAKLNWSITREQYQNCISSIDLFVKKKKDVEEITTEFHPLLETLYDQVALRELYCIRDSIKQIPNIELRLFFNLALSQTLHKASIHPIAVPYIARSKYLVDSGHSWEKFKKIAEQMMSDIEMMPNHERLAQVYNWDSRLKNDSIDDNSCGLCITSPPYLNNLDYGEVSKVHSHFFELTNDWNDITEKVRHRLVTGATTHYRDNEFVIDDFIEQEFARNNPETVKSLVEIYNRIRVIAKARKGKKSFHILVMHYFEDMYYVLKEMYRILSKGSKAYLILGDSAPYGVYIPTTQILGEIAQSVGFGDFKIYKIRERGHKWATLANRHNVELSENILVLNR